MISESLDVAGAVFMAAMLFFMCMDEIVNPGIKPKPIYKIGVGFGCAVCTAWAAYLIVRALGS